MNNVFLSKYKYISLEIYAEILTLTEFEIQEKNTEFEKMQNY